MRPIAICVLATLFLNEVAFKVNASLFKYISPFDREYKFRSSSLSVTLRGGMGPSDTDVASQNYTFTGRKPGDGSDSDPDRIPTRFLNMQKNRRDAAKIAFAKHLAWRKENSVDTILYYPHIKFDKCKAVLPHYFAGRDKVGNPVFVQSLGMIDNKLATRNNVSSDELLMHYVYVIEYCWNILEPRTQPSEGVLTNILDMTNIGIHLLRRGDFIEFTKNFLRTISDNYPMRSYKTFIINAPVWFNSLYQLFKPLLRKSTRQKISVHSKGKKQDEALRMLLGENSVPKELLWKKGKHESTGNLVESSHQLGEPGPNSAEERELRTFCLSSLKRDGLHMEQVI